MRRSVYISSCVNCMEVCPGFTLVEEDVVERVGLFAQKPKVNLDLQKFRVTLLCL
jgi:epoxyqueuosine reductase QueG